MNKGFTLIELVIVIAIITVLSGIVLFSVTQYINKGKDSNISGNLAVLVPVGEVFYTGNGNSYAGFCSSTVTTNSEVQMPQNPYPSGDCTGNLAGVCCYVATNNNAFTSSSNAYCVDSRGMKEVMTNSLCNLPSLTASTRCP